MWLIQNPRLKGASSKGGTEIAEDLKGTAEEEEDQTMAIVIGNDRNLFIGIIASNFN